MSPRVESPSWDKKLERLEECGPEFKELIDAEGLNENPVLIYITSSDKMLVKKDHPITTLLKGPKPMTLPSNKKVKVAKR